MSSPLANVPSSSTFFPNVKSTVLSMESPSTPTSYVSLLDTPQSPGKIFLLNDFVNKINIFLE